MNTVYIMPQNIDTERIRKAKKNRELQLQRWNHFEKQNHLTNYKDNFINNEKKRKIEFNSDVVILEAIGRNDLDEVKRLLEKGANPNAGNNDGLSGLHQCCIDDFIDMAKLLLKYGANVNITDSEAWTPLHAAATCGRDELVHILSDYGADFLSLNADGNMPYDICEGEKCLSTIEGEMSKKGITQEQIDNIRKLPEQKMILDIQELVRRHQNLDKLDSQGASLLHIACSLGFIESTRVLLEFGARVTTPDIDGWLPIHIAACWGHPDIIELLIAYGADIDAPNTMGETVFDICEPEFKPRLLSIKENINNIRLHLNPTPINRYRSFRKSRGSIRRTSVKEKSRLAQKEAKEEFMAMNRQIGTVGGEDKTDSVTTIKEVPVPAASATSATDNLNKSNNDTGSDVDDEETNIKHSKYPNSHPVIAIKPSNQSQNESSKGIPRSPSIPVSSQRPTQPVKYSISLNKNSSTSVTPPLSNHVKKTSLTESTTKDKLSNNTVSTSNNNNSNNNSNNNNHKLPPNNYNDDPLNRSNLYRFCSTTENWDAVKTNKQEKRRGCCNIL